MPPSACGKWRNGKGNRQRFPIIRKRSRIVGPGQRTGLRIIGNLCRFPLPFLHFPHAEGGIVLQLLRNVYKVHFTRGHALAPLLSPASLLSASPSCMLTAYWSTRRVNVFSIWSTESRTIFLGSNPSQSRYSLLFRLFLRPNKVTSKWVK